MSESEASFSMTVQQPGGVEIPLGILIDSVRCWLQSKDLDGGDARIAKHVSQVISDIASRGLSLKISLLYRDHRQEDRRVGVVMDMTNQDNHKFRMPGAKYISILIEDPSVQNVLWRITKLSLIGTTGGGRR